MTTPIHVSARVCIIGAGPSGITAIKQCLQAGLTQIVCYEKQDQVGGNWIFSPEGGHSSVYETTHSITSISQSAFSDYPMPAGFPDFPSHRQILAYFQSYARDFGLLPYIRFNTTVQKAEEQPDHTWRITLDDGTVEAFDKLIVANGHHAEPRWPSYPGEFTGQMLHSHQYKRAEPFRGQRVLVLGGGNSACDIAVETGRISAFTAISIRRGGYIAPKFVIGMPADVLASKLRWLPHPLYARALRLGLWVSAGDLTKYGLEKPKHGILQAHLTLNSEMLYFIRHGKVHPRRDIARFEGKTVHFVDGRAEDYDTIIACTGFHMRFPFFAGDYLGFGDGKPVPLYLLTFDPDHPSLFFVGLVQPLGAIWPLADLQSQLVANAITGRYTPPADMRDQIARDLAYRSRQYTASPRHTVEVEFYPFLEALKREVPNTAPRWPSPPTPMVWNAAPVAG
ncbi:MAG TPA: NAD(P)-binding domain-containing protein [Candidatus Limnocylindrales bacterium]|nr:NAD(P)-binding domain-containing protein [Candidatus Limnocylindrales bacterium]